MKSSVKLFIAALFMFLLIPVFILGSISLFISNFCAKIIAVYLNYTSNLNM